MSAQLVSMDNPIDEGLLVKIFIESFGCRSSLPFRIALLALLTRDDLIWQLVTLLLLQEFALEQGSRLTVETIRDKALVAQQKANKNKGCGSSSSNGVEYWYFGKTGHVKFNCFKRKRDTGNDEADNKKNEGKELVVFARSN